MKNRIVVGIDGSDHSLEALKEAVRLAEAYQSKLFLVNVQPSYNFFHTKMFINDELIKEYQREMFEEATKLAADFMQAQKVDYELILRIGDPTQQICKLAKELSSQYIVIGSRGIGLIKGTVLGSVSNGVLHESRVPVLIIPKRN